MFDWFPSYKPGTFFSAPSQKQIAQDRLKFLQSRKVMLETATIKIQEEISKLKDFISWLG